MIIALHARIIHVLARYMQLDPSNCLSRDPSLIDLLSEWTPLAAPVSPTDLVIELNHQVPDR